MGKVVANEPSSRRSVLWTEPSANVTTVLPVTGSDSVIMPVGSVTTMLPSGFSRVM